MPELTSIGTKINVFISELDLGDIGKEFLLLQPWIINLANKLVYKIFLSWIKILYNSGMVSRIGIIYGSILIVNHEFMREIWFRNSDVHKKSK